MMFISVHRLTTAFGGRCESRHLGRSGKFNTAALCEKYKARAPVSWYLTESMAASRKNGVVIVNPPFAPTSPPHGHLRKPFKISCNGQLDNSSMRAQ
jgi:hypothetical protein